MKIFLTGFILICFLNCKNQKSNLPENSETISQNKEEKRINSKFLSEEELKQFVISSPPITKEEKLSAPFDTLEFNKVIAYEFDGVGGRKIIDSKGNYSNKIEVQKQINDKQLFEFTELITNPKSYGKVTAACFDPKMSLVFYENEVPRVTIDICLDCNYLISSVPIPILEEAHNKVSELGITYGFSEKGVDGIMKLAEELDFKYKDYKPHF